MGFGATSRRIEDVASCESTVLHMGAFFKANVSGRSIYFVRAGMRAAEGVASGRGSRNATLDTVPPLWV